VNKCTVACSVMCTISDVLVGNSLLFVLGYSFQLKINGLKRCAD